MQVCLSNSVSSKRVWDLHSLLYTVTHLERFWLLTLFLCASIFWHFYFVPEFLSKMQNPSIQEICFRQVLHAIPQRLKLVMTRKWCFCAQNNPRSIIWEGLIEIRVLAPFYFNMFTKEFFFFFLQRTVSFWLCEFVNFPYKSAVEA